MQLDWESNASSPSYSGIGIISEMWFFVYLLKSSDSLSQPDEFDLEVRSQHKLCCAQTPGVSFHSSPFLQQEERVSL